jgi:hypothetical protein
MDTPYSLKCPEQLGRTGRKVEIDIAPYPCDIILHLDAICLNISHTSANVVVILNRGPRVGSRNAPFWEFGADHLPPNSVGA